MRQHRIRAGQQRVRAIGLAVALLAAITGCSAEAEQPSAELPPASSSAAETTPELPPLGPEDFPVPDEARTQDEAGAEAFLKYYVDLINRQLGLVGGAPLRSLSQDCSECERIAGRLDQAAASGETFSGGRISLTGEAGWSVTESEAKASFYVRVEAGSQLRSNGEAVEGTATELQERLPSAAILAWSSDQQSWMTQAISFG